MSMINLEELRAKQKAEMESMQRYADMQNAVSAALNLSAENWHAGFMHPTPGADCFVLFKAETLPDALAMAERQSDIPLVLICDGSCVSIRADTPRLTQRQFDKSQRIAPYTYEIGKGFLEQDSRELRYYFNCAGYVVQARVTVAHDPLTRRVYRWLNDKHGNQSRIESVALCNESGYFLKSISWATGGRDTESLKHKAFTLYTL
jgi:hypothetical protein